MTLLERKICNNFLIHSDTHPYLVVLIMNCIVPGLSLGPLLHVIFLSFLFSSHFLK